MQTVVYYDNGTDPATEKAYIQGEIVFVSEFEDSDSATQFAARQPSYTAYFVDTDTVKARSSTHYVAFPGGTPTKTTRPVISQKKKFEIINDGVDEVRFSLPAGTVTTWDFDNSETTNASTEDFVFKTTTFGSWSFLFEPPWPYAPLVIEISSNANV